MCRGCCNRKDATIAFKNHELSACHREAVAVIIRLPATTTHIVVHLSQQYALQIEQNKRMLMKVLSSIRFLSRQGLAFRGHDDDGDGNLIQVLRLLGEDDGEVSEWLQKKSNKYTSPDIQNDVIAIMALRISRSITALLKDSPFLTVMIDKTTDVTNLEQVAIVICRIDANFEVCEEFFGLYGVSSIGAASLFAVIKRHHVTV